jgi:hypothetical protein
MKQNAVFDDMDPATSWPTFARAFVSAVDASSSSSSSSTMTTTNASSAIHVDDEHAFDESVKKSI